MSAQSEWAQALLAPAQALPEGLVTWNRSDPAPRWAVYRNNVMVSLAGALAQTFSVTSQLVGDDFFRAMAQAFIRAHPPRTRVLAHYGQALPGFIARFGPAAGLPYLADVARLEWLRLEALHAADAVAADHAEIAALFADPDKLPGLQWRLHPSLRLLRASHAAVSIWAAHHSDSGLALEDVQCDAPESALVFRHEWDVMVLQADAGLASFVAHLQSGECFGAAVAEAARTDPAFNTAQSMALLIRHKLLLGARQGAENDSAFDATGHLN